jgi:hypothetical protein
LICILVGSLAEFAVEFSAIEATCSDAMFVASFLQEPSVTKAKAAQMKIFFIIVYLNVKNKCSRLNYSRFLVNTQRGHCGNLLPVFYKTE